MEAIIFDIDGVLADSREAVVRNTSQLLFEFGFFAKDFEVERMSSAHSADTVLLALVPQLSNDENLLREMLARLSKLSAENIGLVKPTLISEKIPKFACRYSLAAASNRKTSARMVLAQLGIERHFHTVLTSADAPPKPDPTMIHLALQRLGVESRNAVFVGDNLEDAQAGAGAGVKTVLVDGTKKNQCEAFIEEYLKE